MNQNWKKTLSDAYFPLDVKFRDEANFTGSLKSWSMGEIGVSILECDAVLYSRHENHDLKGNDQSILITIPHDHVVNFKQASRATQCAPGGFLIERSDAPYEFWHSLRNKLWVVKVPISCLRTRISTPERLGALTFDATSGVASYFLGAVSNTINCAGDMNKTARQMAGQHILDMLCLTIKQDERILDSACSSTRAAHLQRAEQFIQDNLPDHDLSSRLVAEACGISIRYLQNLFAENNHSVVSFIRETRLARCHEELTLLNQVSTMAELALKWGFYDQAQFCKYYRNRYECTPSDTKRKARLNLASLK